MVRIFGVNLPAKKRIEVGLTYLYGIGRARSLEVLAGIGIDPNKRTDDITESEANQIRDVIESDYSIEGDLRRDISTNIKRLKDIGSYRGDRHKKGLPVRGQTTKTNARTKRGKKVTIGSGRKKSSEKT